MQQGRSFTISGRVVDLSSSRIILAVIVVENGRIKSITQTRNVEDRLILPPLVDAHVHIESSKSHPWPFERQALRFGTGACVSDPHEIANVCGMEGVHYMLDAADSLKMRICFGAPSCVPASPLETAGATLSAKDIEVLLDDPRVSYLAEVMNFPGVISGDPDMMAKIAAARARGKMIDGHAPGLRGALLRDYACHGIQTDHECFDIDEARGKIAAGMSVLIREGSAARNFDELLPLLDEYPDRVMFCSDDLEPYDLVQGHIDILVRRAIAAGVDFFRVLRAAILNPVVHYRIDMGLCRVGDRADFIVVDNERDFTVLATYLGGERVAENGACLLPERGCPAVINNFACSPVVTSALRVPAVGRNMRVIEVRDGQLITPERHMLATVQDGQAVADLGRGLLKLVVQNRYADAPPAVGFTTGWGTFQGGLASSVAHDSHNIVAVGSSDEDIVAAMNTVIRARGGIAFARGTHSSLLELPLAGLMALGDVADTARLLSGINREVQQAGCPLRAAFMTLSFVSLTVIPELKLSDRGLVNARTVQPVGLWL